MWLLGFGVDGGEKGRETVRGVEGTNSGGGSGGRGSAVSGLGTTRLEVCSSNGIFKLGG